MKRPHQTMDADEKQARYDANAGRGSGRQGEHNGNLARTPRGEALLEYFRRIYLAAHMGADQGFSAAIGVTSSVQREGRTTVATGIAATMAKDLDRPVVLVEVDVANPGVHDVLGVNPTPGLAEYLRNEASLAEAVHQIADRFFVLPAGDGAKEAPSLIYRLVKSDLSARLNANNALFVFDLPPVHSASYGVLASTLAETLVFVVHAGMATDEQVRGSLERLGEHAVRSVVVNAFQPQLPHWLQSLTR